MDLEGLGSSLWSGKGLSEIGIVEVQERGRWRILEAWVLFGFVLWMLVRGRVSRGE